MADSSCPAVGITIVSPEEAGRKIPSDDSAAPSHSLSACSSVASLTSCDGPRHPGDGANHAVVDPTGHLGIPRQATGSIRRRVTADGKRLATIDQSIACRASGEKKGSSRASNRAHPAEEPCSPGKVVSIWGDATDAKDFFVPFFSEKAVNFDGDISRISHRVGLVCHRGHKEGQPNQDDFFILAREDLLLFGVLDGHGPDGHDISHFCQERLPKQMMHRLRKEEPPLSWAAASSASFEEVAQQLKAEVPEKCLNSGTTASVVMLDHVGSSEDSTTLRLRCAFVGDSCCVHAKRPVGTKSWQTEVLTDTHRPERPDEQERILAAGGSVVANKHADLGPKFMCPDLNMAMSRALGDFLAEPYGMSHEPELTTEVVLDRDHEHMIIVASDGIWDMVQPAQVVQFLGKFKPEQAQQAVEKLVAKATLRWQEKEDVVDDITAILICPQFGMPDLTADA